MITDEQKLSLLQMGIKYAETYDEAHDIADFIFGNEQQQIGFSSIGDMLSDAKPQANAKDNVGPAKNGLYIVYGDGAYQIYDELMESFEVRKLQHGGVRRQLPDDFFKPDHAMIGDNISKDDLKPCNGKKKIRIW